MQNSRCSYLLLTTNSLYGLNFPLDSKCLLKCPGVGGGNKHLQTGLLELMTFPQKWHLCPEMLQCRLLGYSLLSVLIFPSPRLKFCVMLGEWFLPMPVGHALDSGTGKEESIWINPYFSFIVDDANWSPKALFIVKYNSELSHKQQKLLM